ncbi:MAG TPA: hypothetical protein VJV40_09955 [Thermodesulfobacteriota bacterium]|nr:hypothetical protein [Thermodesulfobacteriota bacterium]
MNPNLERLIGARVLAERAVWVMITGSVIFYSFLAYKLAGESAGAAADSLSGAEPLFYIAAAAAAVFSVVYRRRSFSDAGVRAILSKFDTGAHGIEDVSALNESEKRAFFLLNELQKASIINLIINEIVIIIGFVLSFLSGDFMKIIPFGIASLVLCLWMFPRTESVAERACGL